MRRLQIAVTTMVLMGTTHALAQIDTSFDTLLVVESTTMSYDNQTVDYFLLNVPGSKFRFIEDSAYVKLLGFIDQGDTSSFSEAVTWMKTANPQVGDAWQGIVPTDNALPTDEQIAGTKMVTVPAGTFPVYEISVWGRNGDYLGEKWYSDGVGLVGWDLDMCNESNSLQLMSYNVSGGGAFWPHQLGDQWVIRSITDRTYTQAPQAGITVDGNASDWIGVTPVLQDRLGDDSSSSAGADIRDVYVATNGGYLYLMADFWDGSPDTASALAQSVPYVFLFDRDGLGNDWGYAVDYDPSPASEWNVTGVNLNDVGAQVAVGTVVEVAVPLANLGTFSNQLRYFMFAVDSGLQDITCTNDVRLPVFCPITMTGDVQGDHNRSSADIVYLVNFVLKGGAAPQPCPAAGDVNCNGGVSTSDIIYMVNTVFKAGPAPCDACAIIPGLWSCP